MSTHVPHRREPRPITVALLCGVVLIVAGAIHLVRYPDLVDAGTPRAEIEPAAEGPDAVGPRVGDDVDAYLAARADALATLTGDVPVRAVVSFADLLGADDVPTPSGAEVEALQVLVPGGDERPEQVPVAAELAAAVEPPLAARTDDLDEEVAELRLLVEEDLGDPAFADDFRDRLAVLEAVRDAPPGSAPVVFAAIVVGSPDALRDLAADRRVRLVDPAGPAATTTATRFTGLLPIDADRVTVGRDRATG